MLTTIEPGASFKDNLQALPSIAGLDRIDLVAVDSTVVASIANQPGQQGSLAVYNYLAQAFGAVNAQAAAHGLLIFAEHVPDAQARPGAHPNIDRLLAIAAGGEALAVETVAAA
ncbi:DUF2322 family protein [Novosphingobium sp. 9]|uniref:DUF2322 family protein n=1 Tax=Novosphingobium sp. 9 TaxID=2025349 RepID=UPI0021B526D1|nr:DUF2322 family protein [Novosphingobium sp. 9]